MKATRSCSERKQQQASELKAPNMASWMLLEGICSTGSIYRAAECWWLASSWKQAKHRGHLLLMSEQRILMGLLSGWTVHTVILTAASELLLNAERPYWAESAHKGGKKESMRLYALRTDSPGKALLPFVRSGLFCKFQRIARKPPQPASFTESTFGCNCLEAPAWHGHIQYIYSCTVVS